MTRVMSIQLLTANIVFATIVITVGMSAKASDRTVYIVRPPWRSASDIGGDIASVGGHVVASAPIPYTTKATLPNADALKGLVAVGSGLVFTASPIPVCGTAARAGR